VESKTCLVQGASVLQWNQRKDLPIERLNKEGVTLLNVFDNLDNVTRSKLADPWYCVGHNINADLLVLEKNSKKLNSENGLLLVKKLYEHALCTQKAADYKLPVKNKLPNLKFRNHYAEEDAKMAAKCLGEMICRKWIPCICVHRGTNLSRPKIKKKFKKRCRSDSEDDLVSEGDDLYV